MLASSALQSEVQGGGGGGGVTNKSMCDMEREAKATKEWPQSDRRISFSSDTSVTEFQYWVESSEGTGGKDEGEGEGDCPKKALDVSDAAESRLPVNTVTDKCINPTPDNLFNHSASDNNCTDVTESVSSLLVSEGIRATTARTLDSGLALHITYRTLRTEVVKYSKYQSTCLLECDMSC
jgi:hypothetical protein